MPVQIKQLFVQLQWYNCQNETTVGRHRKPRAHVCMRSPYMSDYPQCSWCVSSLSAPGNDCIAVVASCLQICLVSVTRGCWIEAPEKNPRSKLKFSNTENGDVCRCVCLWWFRTKFHISGCKCLCQCFSMFVHTRVCVRICTVGSEENKAVQLSAVQWFWFGWPFGFSLSQRAQQSHRTLATTSSLAKTEGLTWKRRMRHSGKEGRERKKGSGSKWENERGSVAVRNEKFRNGCIKCSGGWVWKEKREIKSMGAKYAR